MEKNAYIEMSEVENTHWWFLGRRLIIQSILKNYIKDDNLKILDIGSGTGGNIRMLENFGRVYGLEKDKDASKYSKLLVPNIDVYIGSLPNDVPNFNLEGNFDLITMFDVLEYIERDPEALLKAKKILKPGGLMVLTVPAFQWLFGTHDVELYHFRRYNQEVLKDMSIKASFRLERITYFNFILFPIVIVFRIIDKLFNSSKSFSMKVPFFILNRVLLFILLVEKELLKYCNFPFGSSIIMVLRK